jgi:hypothetical protein
LLPQERSSEEKRNWFGKAEVITFFAVALFYRKAGLLLREIGCLAATTEWWRCNSRPDHHETAAE